MSVCVCVCVCVLFWKKDSWKANLFWRFQQPLNFKLLRRCWNCNVKGFDLGVDGDLGARVCVCVCVCVCDLEGQAGSCCFLGFEVLWCSVVRGHPGTGWPRHSPSSSRLAGSSRLGHAAHCHPRGKCLLCRLCPHLPPKACSVKSQDSKLLTGSFRGVQIPSSSRIRIFFSRCMWYEWGWCEESCKGQPSLESVNRGKPGELPLVRVRTWL